MRPTPKGSPATASTTTGPWTATWILCPRLAGRHQRGEQHGGQGKGDQFQVRHGWSPQVGITCGAASGGIVVMVTGPTGSGEPPMDVSANFRGELSRTRAAVEYR